MKWDRRERVKTEREREWVGEWERESEMTFDTDFDFQRQNFNSKHWKNQIWNKFSSKVKPTFQSLMVISGDIGPGLEPLTMNLWSKHWESADLKLYCFSALTQKLNCAARV